MADTYIGYGYYKDDKGTYKLFNGKKSYVDASLNTDDDSTLVTNRGGTPIWTDGTSNFTYNNGVKVDLVTKKPIEDNPNADTIKTNGQKLSNSWYLYNNTYWCIFADGTVTKGSESLYKSSQRTPAEQAKVNGAPVYLETSNSLAAEQAEEQAKLDNKLSGTPDAVSGRMNTLASMITGVTNRLNSHRPIYTMYVDFQVMIAGQWVTLCNSTSKDWINNCLVMLKNKISGAGNANTFELQIMFKQNDRNIQNIDSLEAKLLSTCDITTTVNGEQTLIDLKDAAYNCKFQYGYGDDPNLRSPWYTGRIMDYDCDLNNGNLKYTISGFAGIYGVKEVRLTTKSEYKPEDTTSPLKYIENIFNVEFGEGSQYAGLYKLKMLVSNPDEVVNTDPDFKQFTNKNLFEILSDILAGTAIQEQIDKIKNGQSYNPGNQVLFSYYLDSAQADGETFAGTIYVYKTPSCYDKDCDLTPHAGITFNYFGPGSSGTNHIVKSWKPQYNGSVLLNLATAIKMSGQKFQTMDNTGKIIDVIGMGAARLGTLDDPSTVFNTIQEYSKWSFATQYCYKASMTTMGIPCEAPITGLMQINCIMSSTQGVGYKHHTSGIYMILGKTDTISNSGFYTDFDLFKMTKSTPDTAQQVIDSEDGSIRAGVVVDSQKYYDRSVPGTSETSSRDRVYIQKVTKDGIEIGFVKADENVMLKREVVVNGQMKSDRIYGKYIYSFDDGKTKLGYVTNDGTIKIY